MAVITKLVKGFDPDYPFKQQDQRAGDYFDVKGEPPGRWWGKGAAALGLAPGSEVDRKTHRMVIADHLDPRDPEGKTRLGRAPGNAAARAEAIYQEKLAAEPHATLKRQYELRKDAQREARQGPVYLELDNSFSKSITVYGASFGAAARAARAAGDEDGQERWSGMVRELEEMIYAANQAGLDYFEREAGYTRSGYHGRRVDGQETGHFDEAALVIEQFLQHTSRDDDPHLHVHNLIATVARTVMDGKWRTPDSWGYNEVYTAVSAIVSLHLEAAMTRRWGVRWVPRGCQCAHGKCADPAECDSNFGCEIDGITRADVDCFSTRRQSVDKELRERATEFERENGRAPTQRELAQLHEAAWDSTRKQKPEGGIDFDDLHSRWTQKMRAHGRELESLAAEVWDQDLARAGGRKDEDAGDAQLGPALLRRTALKALARCQARNAKWSRYQLIHELGSVMPPQARDLAPERMLPLLESLADRVIAGEFEPVACLDAPELFDVPDSLRRSDGRPVFRRHMGTKYATAAHLSLEERLLADAARRREPLVEPERAAQLLGSDSATLAAQLERRAEAGSTEVTATGLRMDQAAAIWAAITGLRTSVVITGPAGSGKTFTLAAAAKAATQAGVRHVYGTAPSQAARNALAEALARAGVRATVLNSTQFLDRVSRPATDRHRLVIAPGSLILTDEASMLPAGHAAAVKAIAARTGSLELTAGDQEQLQAVTEGGAMGLQARRQGYLQLTEPVRFTREWERDATLRLRAGDASVAEVYDQQARLYGASPEEALEGAAQMAVTLLADGKDVILMARGREHVQELSRRVRGELVRLGLAGNEATVPLAEGARAGVHDLVVIRKNDHTAGLANGDVVRVEAVEDDGRVRIRKAAGRDPDTGAPVFAGETMLRESLRQADPAYARTVHTAQGGQGDVGIAVVTGNEDRQWLYPAMTRGRDANVAWVMSSSPRRSDPAAGARPAPELPRYDRLQRMHDGLPPDPEPGQDDEAAREAAAVFVDVVERDGTELSATEYRDRQLANADHLGLLDSQWQDAAGKLRDARYTRLLRELVPAEYEPEPDKSPTATWLWRTLRAAEAAGMDAREVMQAAVDSRPLTGARDVAAVIDGRIRRQIDVKHLVPQPQGRWSDRVPQADDPDLQKYLDQLAAAMDGRAERLGQFTAATAPQWALNVLGPVPEDAQARGEWERKAAPAAAYRELYDFDSDHEAIGPEPTMATPEKRAAWHAAAAAIGRPTDGPDLRGRDEASLWLMRDAYEAETRWAPPFVTPQLRSARAAVQHEELARGRALAEARAAEARGDHERAERQRTLAATSETLRDWHAARIPELEQAERDYGEWTHLTAGPLAVAVAADAELRRTNPGLAIPPLRTAEREPEPEPQAPLFPPEPPKPAPDPAAVAAAQEALAAFYDKHAAAIAEIEQARRPASRGARAERERREPGEDLDLDGLYAKHATELTAIEEIRQQPAADARPEREPAADGLDSLYAKQADEIAAIEDARRPASPDPRPERERVGEDLAALYAKHADALAELAGIRGEPGPTPEPEPERQTAAEQRAAAAGLADLYAKHADSLAEVRDAYRRDRQERQAAQDRAAERAAFREELAERQSMRVPDPDPDYADHGPAWPQIEPAERDTVLQPPEPQMTPAPGINLEACLEAGQ